MVMKTIYKMIFQGNEQVSFLDLQPLSKNDIDEYTKLVNDAFKEEFAPYALHVTTLDTSKNLKHIFVYKENNSIISAVSIRDNEIDDLFVAPSYQHLGYGEKTLRSAISIMQKKDKNIFLWTNENLLSFYGSIGFVVEKTMLVPKSL